MKLQLIAYSDANARLRFTSATLQPESSTTVPLSTSAKSRSQRRLWCAASARNTSAHARPATSASRPYGWRGRDEMSLRQCPQITHRNKWELHGSPPYLGAKLLTSSRHMSSMRHAFRCYSRSITGFSGIIIPKRHTATGVAEGVSGIIR